MPRNLSQGRCLYTALAHSDRPGFSVWCIPTPARLTESAALLSLIHRKIRPAALYLLRLDIHLQRLYTKFSLPSTRDNEWWPSSPIEAAEGAWPRQLAGSRSRRHARATPKTQPQLPTRTELLLLLLRPPIELRISSFYLLSRSTTASFVPSTSKSSQTQHVLQSGATGNLQMERGRGRGARGRRKRKSEGEAVGVLRRSGADAGIGVDEHSTINAANEQVQSTITTTRTHHTPITHLEFRCWWTGGRS
jgi:hypothetical protein